MRDEARGGGLRGRGQDEPARVRLRHHLGQPALRRRHQPARRRPDPGRVERRERRCARRRSLRGRARDRQRRLDPPARSLLWGGRLQADLGSGARRRRLRARTQLRHGRADGTLGLGLRGRDARAGRACPVPCRERARRPRLDGARRPARPRPCGRGRGAAPGRRARGLPAPRRPEPGLPGGGRRGAPRALAPRALRPAPRPLWGERPPQARGRVRGRGGGGRRVAGGAGGLPRACTRRLSTASTSS